jgi:hypothetical protein
VGAPGEAKAHLTARSPPREVFTYFLSHGLITEDARESVPIGRVECRERVDLSGSTVVPRTTGIGALQPMADDVAYG